jgi:hypothetical protein
METQDAEALKRIVLVSDVADTAKLRDPEDKDIEALLKEPFTRGRILDQRRQEGASRNFDYLVYREPGGQVFALLVTTLAGHFRVVIPERPLVRNSPFLWDYQWNN